MAVALPLPLPLVVVSPMRPSTGPSPEPPSVSPVFFFSRTHTSALSKFLSSFPLSIRVLFFSPSLAFFPSRAASVLLCSQLAFCSTVLCYTASRSVGSTAASLRLLQPSPPVLRLLLPLADRWQRRFRRSTTGIKTDSRCLPKIEAAG